MLQRRAREGIRKVVVARKCCCKASYATTAEAREAAQEKELNALITVDTLHQEALSNQRDDVPFVKRQTLRPKWRGIAVKDNIATIGSATTCGSGILREHESPFEAGVVSCLRLGGAVVSGKTNLDEFGMGSHSTNSFFGPVSNVPPFDNLSPGGSSGGSAAAVASGKCAIALGTDTGGSVRLPAAYTGIIGFKPSYGAISRWGVIPFANSMDTVGIMSKKLQPLRQTFRLARQHDPRDPTSVTDIAWKRFQSQWKSEEKIQKSVGQEPQCYSRLSGTRIGVPVEYNIAELEPGIRRAWQACLDGLQKLGATIVPVSLPNTKHALSAYYVLAPAEAASNLSKYDGVRYGTRDDSADGASDVLYAKTRGDGFGEEVRRRILLGSYTLSSEAVNNYFLKAQKVRRLVQRDFGRVFSASNGLRPPEQFDLSDMDPSVQMESKLGPSQVDFIVCPTTPTLPPTLDEVSKQTPVDTYMNDVFTVPASLAGIPAISVPFPIPEEFQVEGKPAFAGIQVVGQYASDETLLDMAAMIQLASNTPKKSTSHKLDVGVHKYPVHRIRKVTLKEDIKPREVNPSGSNKHTLKVRRYHLDRDAPLFKITKMISEKGSSAEESSQSWYRLFQYDTRLDARIRYEWAKRRAEKPVEDKILKVSTYVKNRRPTTNKEIAKIFGEALDQWDEGTQK